MNPPPWPAVAAGLLALGLLLLLGGRWLRRTAGLGAGRTASLDRVTLTSKRLGLTGRPDRIVRRRGAVIVEEWKSARVLRPWHRAQLAVYFLLIEERFGIRPGYGVVVLGDGRRHRVENTEALRVWVLGMADQIRAARRLGEPIPVRTTPAQCRPCGMRGHCGQAAVEPLN